ncbi:MAG: Holliday junction resolvase RuvX [Gammaproteobacteria bacterium]|nr:Holliday junction resolvase RuvX [Gammaproteobacteria bacterium]
MSKAQGTQQTVLGFDFGTRRIGVAVGETVTGTAHALACLHGKADSAPPWPAILNLVREWRPGRLVVGRPRHLDGRDSTFTQSARDFADELGRRAQLPVELWDEALSTEAARETLAGQRQQGARRGGRDQLNAQAACEILRGWLTEVRHD